MKYVIKDMTDKQYLVSSRAGRGGYSHDIRWSMDLDAARVFSTKSIAVQYLSFHQEDFVPGHEIVVMPVGLVTLHEPVKKIIPGETHTELRPREFVNCFLFCNGDFTKRYSAPLTEELLRALRSDSLVDIRLLTAID